MNVRVNGFGKGDIEVPLDELYDFRVELDEHRNRLMKPENRVKHPRWMLTAVLSCTSIPDGAEFRHFCDPSTAPHRFRVRVRRPGQPVHIPTLGDIGAELDAHAEHLRRSSNA